MSGPDCENCGEYFLDCNCMADGPGRPPAKIDWNDVEEKIRAGCDGVEIAAGLGIHQNTFYDRCLKDNNVIFTEYYQRCNSSGKSELRLAQFKKAIGKLPKGDSAMLKHLGEHRLGQKEIKTNESTDNTAAREVAVLLSEILKDNPRFTELLQSHVETEQPVLHQGRTGEQSEIQPQLGTEGTK